MNTNQKELNRIKELMHYGLNENKTAYSSVEYSKVGADGKAYGIVREGTKYYIKVSKDKNNLIKENFDYIGGFMNRKNNEYHSFANALKQFDLKMASLKEAYADGKNVIVESWNPEKKEFLALETTERMRKEIMRQRQIMENAKRISEKKDSCCVNLDGTSQPFNEEPKADCKNGYCFGDQEKNNIGKAQAPKKGKSIKETADRLAWHKTGGNAQETIADTYMDKSSGTNVGNGSPFNRGKNNKDEMDNGVVEEHNTSMAYSDNQNSPEPGTNSRGKDNPFTKKGATQIQEEIDDLDDSSVIDDESGVSYGPASDTSYDAEYDTDDYSDDMEGDDLGYDDELSETDTDEPYDSAEDEIAGDDMGDEGYADDMEGEDFGGEPDLGSEEDLGGETCGDVESRLSSIESTLSTILDKLENINTSEYEDDDLYSDDDDDLGDDMEGDDFEGDDFEGEDDDLYSDEDDLGGESYGDDMEGEDFGGEDDFGGGEDFGDEDDDNQVVYESRSYRKMKNRLNEVNRLNDFGKHPAYRKEPMQLPPTGADQNSHGRDWNDSSVHSEEPYGQKIGKGAPFEIAPEAIENAIVDEVRQLLKKK